MKSKPLRLRQVFTQATYRVILFSAIFLCLGSTVLMAVISRKNVQNTLSELAERKSENVKSILTSASETMRNITYDAGLQNLLAQYAGSEGTESLLYRIKVNSQLQNQSMFFAQADNIIVYSPDGVSLGNKYEVDAEIAQYAEELLEMVQDNGNLLWLINMEGSGDHENIECIMISEIRSSRSIYGTKLNDLLGYLVVQYDFSDVMRTLETEQSGYNAHLVSMEGKVLCSTAPEEMLGTEPELSNLSLGGISRLHINGISYYAAVQKIELPAVSFYCVCTAPIIKTLEDVFVAIVIILLFSIMTMIFTYFVIRRRANRICCTFEQMNRAFGLIEKGKLDLDTFSETGVVEVDDLTKRFSHMADRLEQVMYELYEAELHKQSLLSDRKEAELMAVRMQINPHFLYNTLDTINWMALSNGDNEVSEMVLMMGRLLRSNLSLSTVSTTVQMELERVELFVQLEQKRFGDGLRYEAEAEEALLEEPMPGMMIQILVENAINHGLRLGAGQGLVQVRIWMEEGQFIVVTVSDNGHGMEPEVAQELRQAWELAKKDPRPFLQPSHHIGLRNIMKRLRLLYGNQGNFSFETGPHGTQFRLSYPKQFR